MLMLGAQNSQAQQILHYWHFNNLPTGTLGDVAPDSSLIAGAYLRYSKLPSASAAYTGGIMDRTNGEGTTENNRYGTIAGNTIRPRNPSDSMQFLLFIPSTGFQSVVLSYASARTSQGAQNQLIDYSLDSGVTFTTAGLTNTLLVPVQEPTFTTYSFNFAGIPGANNNPRLVVRVRFAVNASGGSGNNRFDNIVLEGVPVGSGSIPPQVNLVSVVDSLRIQILFNKALRRSSAETIANYSVTPSIGISSATYDSITFATTLTLASRLANGSPYTVQVNNIIAQDSTPMAGQATSGTLLYNDYSGSGLVISEIMYNAGTGAGADTLEFMEIHNRSSVSVPMGGLRIADGVTGTWPVFTLTAGASCLFAADTGVIKRTFGSSLQVFPFIGSLSNGGELLTIRNFFNRVLDSVEYDDVSPWPTAPDGTGPSLELINVQSDNALGSNWRASLTPTGKSYGGNPLFASPGAIPSATSVEVGFAAVVRSTQEQNGTVRIPFNLIGTPTDTVKFNVMVTTFGTATQGQDFTFSNTQVVVAPQATSIDSLTISIIGDTQPEADEYIVLRLTNGINVNLQQAASFATVYILDNDKQAPVASEELTLTLVSSFRNKTAGSNSAEIVAYDSASRRLFIANSIGGELNILDFANPASPVALNSVSMNVYGGINSVAVRNGIVAAAVENNVADSAGSVVFFNTSGIFQKQVRVGVLPDMITFSPDGTKIMTANEAQPLAGYTADPVGSVSIIDLTPGVANLTQSNVRTVSFAPLNGRDSVLRSRGIRIFGPGSTVEQDLEPEYVVFSDDSKTAFVACQENNACIVIDVDSARIAGVQANNPRLFSFGLKDHSLPGNELDASDLGGEVRMANWSKLKGIVEPDAIALYRVNGVTYLIGANEGDAREGFNEETTVSAMNLDTTAFPQSIMLKNSQNLGRLTVSNSSGDLDSDGDFDEIHVFGGRSITIWDTTGQVIWDSGDQMERITRQHPVFGAIFNANQTGQAFKNRSDNKGPEPEGVVVERIGNDWFAFVALERIGGCMVWKVTNPLAPVFVTYVNNRSIPYNAATNDAGAEGILYIRPSASPDGQAYLLLANEVSSSISVFRVTGGPLGFETAVAQENIRFTAWPNPVSGDKVQLSKKASGVVLNAKGSVVYTFVNTDYLPTTELSKGLYLIQTIDNQSIKLIKE